MRNLRTLKEIIKRTPGVRLGRDFCGRSAWTSCILRLTSYIIAACLLFVPIADAADIYYSAGTDASDLKTASTVTISGGNTAGFSAAQPDHVGMGDRITYNTSSVAYIVSRASSTQFTVATATGGVLANGGPWTVNAIERAFNTLNNAVDTGKDPNPSDAAYLNTDDLTSGPYTLYIVCYGDAAADTTEVNISGWITDAVNSLNIIPSAEARHKGRWDTGAYRLVITSGDAVMISDDNVSVSGLQIELSATAQYGIVTDSGMDNVLVSGNIITYSGANPANAVGIQMEDGGIAGRAARIWNNIVYGFLGTGNAGISVDFSGSNSKAYVSNNTLYNNTTGIDDASGSGSIVAKNTIAYWNGDNYGGSGTFDAASANNLSGPNTDAQVPGINAQDGVAVQFIDVIGGDFRLAATDAAAQDTGADLNADADLSFSDDIEGQRRGRLWDIGADERAARILHVTSVVDPIVVELGDGTAAEDFQLTFSDAASGLDSVKKGGYGTTWGSDLIPSGTLFTIGGESGAAAHTIFENGAGEVIIRKARAGIISHYHIYPSGRVVLDAGGANFITVNQTATFSEYADGIAHSGGYHAYADLIETAASSSGDYLTPDTPGIISGDRAVNRAFDYTSDGFEEGRGSYPVIASAGSATVDFSGDIQTLYSPVLLLEEFYPETEPSAALSLYWDATDTIASGSEVWTGALTSTLSVSTGLRGSAQENDTAGDYASLQTTSNISDPGTLSLWVKSSSNVNPSSDEYIFFADTDRNLYFDAQGRLNFRISTGADLTTASDIYDNAWHQVTCTWDYAADEYALYLDGKPVDASTASYGAPAFDAAMVFTAQDASGTNRFAGSLDEVRIYDDVVKPTGRVLFHSRADAAADITAPQVGSPGTVAGTTSFTSGVRGNAIAFDAAGEYATLPSAGNITAAAGTLEMWVKSNSAVDPSVVEQVFFGDADFNIFFDADGQINFKISGGVNLTGTADTYDSLWHHVKVLWDYAADRYFLYVDGAQVSSSAAAYSAPSMDATIILGAADTSDTSRYNGMIDGILIYDAMILPYGAYHVPVAWGDSAGLADATVLLYWDAASTPLDIGAGSATLGGGMTAGAGINGSGLVNDVSGEYASFPSAGNIINNEGSLAFWVKSGDAGNPSGLEHLFYASTNFHMFFDASGFLHFNISSGVSLPHAVDIYDAGWHYVRCTWDYTDDLYELFVDGIRRAQDTGAYAAPVFDAELYVTAVNNAGANRFAGSLDEMSITHCRSTPVIASAYGLPVMPPQAGMPYSYRVDVSSRLDGILRAEHLTPLSDFISSAAHSPSEYSLQYFGNISTTGSPSISGITAGQNANAGVVTVNYTGTDPDNDTVTYVAGDCEYSLDSTDGSNGTWNDMTTAESGETFDSDGASFSYVWDAASDTNVYDGIVYLRLKVRDGMGHESKYVAMPPIAVDTLAPAGLGALSVSATATTMTTLSWTAATDDNWLNNAHYEIWYGNVVADVENRDGTALKWDSALDSELVNRTIATTTVTSLSTDTSYFFKIWAVDGFNNESTVAGVSASTTAAETSRVYSIQIDPIYDAAADAILVTTSLLVRSGTIVTDLTNLTLTYVGVLNNAGTLLSGNLNGPGDTISGTTNAIFYTTWDPAAGLTANMAYTIISKVSYSGEIYSGAKAFNVGELGGVTQDVIAVEAQVDTLTTSVTSFDGRIDTFTQKIDDHETTQVTFRDTRRQELAALETQIGSIAEDTSTSLTDFIENEFVEETVRGVQTEIITRQTTVVTGATVPIRFRMATGFSPTITVYDPDNVTKISNALMSETGTTEIYSYDVNFYVSWGLGDFTVLIQEPTSGSVDSVMMEVVSSLTTGGTADSSSISTDLIYSRLNNMDSDITNLVEGMDNVSTVTADVGGDIDGLISELGAAVGTGGVDAQAISNITASVGAVIGQDGDGAGYETVLGRLSGLEGMLAGIGANASAASSVMEMSRSKAKAIRKIASKIQKLLDDGELEAAQEEMLNMGERLVELKRSTQQVPGAVTTDSLSEEMQASVDELNRLAAEKGIEGLIPPIDLLQGGSAMDPEDIIEVRNEVNELKSLMTEVRISLDQGINAPIVHSWFEAEY
ncbi:MAG: hypothetical protein KAS66_06215 [Candidatus Omnitrophica bacterium]|nr:hypothetical protein [Candidatus Omnitrophota bacterium]